MIIGGADAADIAEKYGTLCSFYYPVKGMILNGMKVDQYDDYIQPDFIAPRSEYEFQLIGSLSVGLLVRMLLRAGIVFLKNFIKDKEGESVMKEPPVNKIMENTLEKMREMVDVSTIIGDPMVTGDTTLIPVSKVTYGFTSGGTDLPSKQQNQELFGGGGGGGITITPVAFIVIEKGKCRMMQINNYTSSADRAVSMIPELVDKLTELLKAKDGKADEAETPAAE